MEQMKEQPLDAWVAATRSGDIEALEALVGAVQDRIYGLAMRMLGHPQDAQDATQEILVKMLTRLDTFRGECAFPTWVYRIASNHLLTTRQRSRERATISFEEKAREIELGLRLAAEVGETEPERRLLTEEVRLNCTHGMLLCLDRDARIAYILGEVFEVTSQEGAAILDISPAAFRQRLARARHALRAFMRDTCGLVNPANACRCTQQVAPARLTGKLTPQRLHFATHPAYPPSAQLTEARAQLHALDRAAGVFRQHPAYKAPDAFVGALRRLIASKGFGVFGEEA